MTSQLAPRDFVPVSMAQTATRPFGALALSIVSSCPGAVQLTRGAADSRDQFMLFHVTDGEIGLAQDRRDLLARPGDSLLHDQTRPFTLDFTPLYRSWMLSIPGPLLQVRLRRAWPCTAHLFAGDSKFGALVGTIIQQLDGFGADMREEVIDRIGTSALDIIATALEANLGGTPPQRAAQHRLLANAEAFMGANLHQSGLDIETIASALHTSPRTLNRAFAGAGTTPMRWFWRQRLEACNRALAHGRVKSVTEAAFSYGFNDVSHFSRAFKKAFGQSPRSLHRR